MIRLQDGSANEGLVALSRVGTQNNFSKEEILLREPLVVRS